ncbi:MAG: hypothetical protein J5535_06955 [Firmicutes bacterium]|nr:hypothetical protein [Bacillota bacterium]
MTSARERYSDIIDMEYHGSASHPRMSAEGRAGQFSPFAALTGFDEQIDEAADSFDGTTEVYAQDYENDIYRPAQDD